jgi:hypothetical protein
MRTVPVLTGAEAAQLIADSAVITVSSSSGLGCPDAVLEAIGQRYEETGSPANLTTLHRSPPGEANPDLGPDPVRGRYLRPEYQPHPAKGSFNALGSELPSSAEKRDVTRLRGGVGP